MLKFEEQIVEFEFRGEKHEARVPNNADIRQYRKEIKSCEDDDKREDCLYKFLGELGIKKEILDCLTPNQSVELLNAVSGAKKN